MTLQQFGLKYDLEKTNEVYNEIEKFGIKLKLRTGRGRK